MVEQPLIINPNSTIKLYQDISAQPQVIPNSGKPNILDAQQGTGTSFGAEYGFNELGAFELGDIISAVQALEKPLVLTISRTPLLYDAP